MKKILRDRTDLPAIDSSFSQSWSCGYRNENRGTIEIAKGKVRPFNLRVLITGESSSFRRSYHCCLGWDEWMVMSADRHGHGTFGVYAGDMGDIVYSRRACCL